jgi:hypothetical protein
VASRQQEASQDPQTDGGGSGPPRKPPPPPRATAEMYPQNDGDSGPSRHEGKGFKWKGWEDRVNADPSFVYKVCVEQVRMHAAPRL